MMVFRLASAIAALVTIILNASYGFRSATTLEYAILFAALNAALDVAKCSCLVGAALAWRAQHRLAATLLFLLFWPLLANSLWCGLSEVTYARAAHASRHATQLEGRAFAQTDYARATAELAAIEASPQFNSSTACALPTSPRERTLCRRHADVTARLQAVTQSLATNPAADPAPQLTLLATITGWPLATLLLAAAFWPIALAELCSSVGFYLTAKHGRTETPVKRFDPLPATTPPTPPQNPPPTPAMRQTPVLNWRPVAP